MLKGKLLSFSILFIFISLLSLSTVFAATYYVNGTWSAAILNGSSNGVYYPLNPGTASVSLTATILERPYNVPGTVEYRVTLRKYNPWWIDESLGTRTHTATDAGKLNYASWTVNTSANHYFYFDKDDVGVYRVNIQGPLSN